MPCTAFLTPTTIFVYCNLIKSSGNAWAAAGTVRVLQTILRSEYAWELKDDAHDMMDYATEIISAGWYYQVDVIIHIFLRLVTLYTHRNPMGHCITIRPSLKPNPSLIPPGLRC